ncbi:hypothetical protein EDB84DRAFT_1562092 [Lactarius hengduanensis]|nr:hypothetical protein EDB84DRAFT_1562092 [Lactarius hengduanensis]
MSDGIVSWYLSSLGVHSYSRFAHRLPARSHSHLHPIAFAPAVAVANALDLAFFSPLCNPCGIPSTYELTWTRLRTTGSLGGIGPVDLTLDTLSPDSNTPIPTVTDNLFSQGTIA